MNNIFCLRKNKKMYKILKWGGGGGGGGGITVNSYMDYAVVRKRTHCTTWLYVCRDLSYTYHLQNNSRNTYDRKAYIMKSFMGQKQAQSIT